MNNTELERKFSQKLISIGILPNIKGYRYLRSALIQVYNDNSALDCITKVLYPNIAKEYDTTPSRVERGIRHAISKTDTKLRNSEFIGLMAEEMRLKG